MLRFTPFKTSSRVGMLPATAKIHLLANIFTAETPSIAPLSHHPKCSVSSSQFRPQQEFGDSSSEVGSGGMKFTPQGLKVLDEFEESQSPIYGSRGRLAVRGGLGMIDEKTGDFIQTRSVVDPAAQPLLKQEDHDERARRLRRYRPVSLAVRKQIADDSPHKDYHKISPENGFGDRVDDFLKKSHPDFSRDTFDSLVQSGHVYRYNPRTGKKAYVKMTDRLQNGDYLVIPKAEFFNSSVIGSTGKNSEVYESLRTGSGEAARQFKENNERRNEIHLSYKTKQEALDWVLFKNSYVVVLNKPSGVPIGRTFDGSLNLNDMLPAWKFTNTQRPLICNHLDRDTSGIVVLARTPDTHRMLSKMFQKRQVPNSTYWGMCVGTPKAITGRIKMHLETSRGGDGSRSTIARLSPTPDSKVAISEFVVNANAIEYASFVSFYPLTSQPDQLRIMASHALRCPIIGDGKYGGESSFPENLDALLGNTSGDEMGRKATKMHLHFRKIQLPYKKRSGEFECVSAPLPTHMKRTFQRLGWATDLDDPLIPG